MLLLLLISISKRSKDRQHLTRLKGGLILGGANGVELQWPRLRARFNVEQPAPARGWSYILLVLGFTESPRKSDRCRCASAYARVVVWVDSYSCTCYCQQFSHWSHYFRRCPVAFQGVPGYWQRR